MRLLWILALCVLAVGCHGSDLRLGVGRDFSGLHGHGSAATGCHEGTDGSWSIDGGDSTSIWAEVSIALTPQSVVLETPSAHAGLLPTYEPVSLHPSACAPVTRVPTPCERHKPQKATDPPPDWGAAITELDTRLTAIEGRKPTSWSDALLGGGTGTGGVLAIFLTLQYYLRRRRVSEGPKSGD